MEMVKGLGGGIMGRALAASASMSDNHLTCVGGDGCCPKDIYQA